MFAKHVGWLTRNRVSLSLIALFLVPPADLIGQRVPRLEPDAQVRVMAPSLADSLLVGRTGFSFARDTLVLVTSKRAAINIPHSAIVRLEVNRRRSRWAEGFLLAGGVGAASFYYVATQKPDCGMFCGLDQAFGAILGGVVGGLFGAAIGATIETGPDRWKPVHLRSTR